MKPIALVLLSFLALGATAQTRLVPHVTPSGGSFATTLILSNTAASDQVLNLMLFDQNGNAYPDANLMLAAGETQTLDPHSLVDGSVSHIMVGNDNAVEITVVYQDALGRNSPAHIPTTTEQAFRWRIFPGTMDDVVDGIAVWNTDDVSRQIHVRQMELGVGETSRSTPLNLLAKAKGLHIFDTSSRTADTYFEVFSDGPMAITALRFSTGDNLFFWQTAAVGLPALIENQNTPPTIVGQADLSVVAGQSLTIQLSDLVVIDPDNEPGDFTLMVDPGSNYTVNGNTITPSEGFAGVLSVPVRINDGEDDSQPYLLDVMVTAPANPLIGKVATLRNNPTYNVSGRAVITSLNTIELQNFTYNGAGPDVRVYLGVDNDFVNGPIISDAISGQVYNNATVVLTLPDNVNLEDYNSISIWCTIFSLSFSEGTFE